MAIRDVFKVSWKTFINPLGWIDFDSLKDQNKTIFSILKTLFSPEVPEHTESFEEAQQRLNLTEEEIHETQKRYRHFALLFLLIGIIIFVYSFYLLIYHVTILGFILGISVSCLFFAYAFRYDFWAYQIKHKKLGATFNEWKQSIVGGNKDVKP